LCLLINGVRVSSTARGFDGSDLNEGTFAKNFPKIFSSGELLRLKLGLDGNKRGNTLFMGIKNRRRGTCCDNVERPDLFANNAMHIVSRRVPGLRTDR
jgi:hypothetical protein